MHNEENNINIIIVYIESMNVRRAKERKQELEDAGIET